MFTSSFIVRIQLKQRDELKKLHYPSSNYKVALVLSKNTLVNQNNAFFFLGNL